MKQTTQDDKTLNLSDKQKDNSGEMKFPKMKTRRVWLSCYFRHYNAIVIFKNIPHLTKANEGWENLGYDYYDLIHKKNKDIIAGVCYLEDFQSWFPDINIEPLIQENGNVISCEPTTLIEAKMTAPFDRDGKLINIDFTLDGYQNQ